MQKQRRRAPLQSPPVKPSVLQTEAQLVSLKHIPLNLWLCDSHFLPSAIIGPISAIITFTYILLKAQKKNKSKQAYDDKNVIYQWPQAAAAAGKQLGRDA